MKSYLITYDLIKPHKDYSTLTEALEKFSNYWHCLGSVWIVKSDSTATEIRDYLLPYIDKDDKLLVIFAGREAAWTTSFSQQCQNWLRNNL